MAATAKQRQQFVATLAIYAQDGGALSPYTITERATKLLRLGTTYGRIQELWCNGPNPPNGLSAEAYNRIQARYDTITVPAYERKEARLEARIAELASQLGATVEFQGDPRGYTVKLVWPPREPGLAPREAGIPTS